MRPNLDSTYRRRIEETLDPMDWEEFRKFAHGVIDDTVGWLSTVRERAAWTEMPEAVRAAFDETVPMEGSGARQAYAEFVERVRPYPNGNLHPRFWGWVQGTGTPLAMIADMLAAGLNPHMAGFNQAPALVERQVLRWLTELMGFPQGSSGVLTSGGTMANLIGLTVARGEKAGFDVREQGLQGYRGPRLVFYGSAETHGWCQKAAELLGLGNSAYRRVAVGADYRMDVEALRALIETDRRESMKPFCVVGNAGTINTGATDDLRALSSVCKEEGLWFHVDGAFGALARWSQNLRGVVDGIEEADSLAFDLHKWMYLPFEVGCVLVRDAEAHVRTFAAKQNYFGDTERGVIGGGLPFAERGIELTRSFRALKVWMSLKAEGVAKYARLIEQNVAQAAYLAELIGREPEMELLAPVALNVVCFRVRPRGMAEVELDLLNKEVLLRVQESGVAVPSSTALNGKFALRVAITNHRSRREDFEALVRAVRENATALAAETGSAAKKGFSQTSLRKSREIAEEEG
jgi:aromatic-L-amino-acid/L-tryptophan decarboxylase